MADPVSGTTERRLWEELKAEREKVRKLERELTPLRDAEAKRALIAEQLEKATVASVSAKPWPKPKSSHTTGPGTPTLILSDLHVNETVEPNQVLGANAFSPERAGSRLRTCFSTAVDIGRNHMVKPSYDGIEVPVLGDLLDLLGGFFHKSERQARPVGLDAAAVVADLLEPGFMLMADAFGAVRSRWVTGNHGRFTVEMPYQDRSAKSLDAAVYHILEGRLRKDKRFHFELAPGPRLIYQLYGVRYMILHGDPASGMPKGGDAEAGAANKVARGIKRLRSLHMQIGMPFDVALMGHEHVEMRMPGIFVNGSLPGFSEYAFGRAFPFEPPKQILFFTHPRWGITATWPIYVDRGEKDAA
jgi:hypothetical protein